MELNVFITWCSPAGSTRKVAETIKSTCSDLKINVHTLDLGKDGSYDDFVKKLSEAGKNALLFVGSPVYKGLIIPPVKDFLENIPQTTGAFAVPFVTWGQATTGIALWQIGAMLASKGYNLAAGAKIMAVHSMMWHTDNPAGKGHPTEESLNLLRKAVESLIEDSRKSGLKKLDLNVLDYQPEAQSNDLKQKMNDPMTGIPKTVKTDICTQCGICAEVCPASAIELNPYPEFLSHCFGCMSCVKECPENAIESAVPLTDIEKMIRQRIETINERPDSMVFLP